MSVCALLPVCVLLSVFAAALERVDLTAEHELTCGQGLFHCEVESGAGECLCDDSCVEVSALEVTLEQKGQSLCLKILLNITIRGVTSQAGGGASLQAEPDAGPSAVAVGSGDEERECVHEDHDNMTTASVCVCYTDTSPHKLSKTIHFAFHSSTFDGSGTLKSWISLEVEILKKMLGAVAVVHSSSKDIIKQIDIPPEEEICFNASDVIFCKGKEAPRLVWRTDESRGIVLYVAEADKSRFQEFSVCQKLERIGSCLKVEWNNPSLEFVISPSSVAPCLCFTISGNFTSTEYCPFLNEMAVSSSSVLVSLSEAQTHHHRPALLWDITAPCRLEARLWLCEKDSLDSHCRPVNDRPHFLIHWNASWIQTKSRQWYLQGEFLHMARHPLLCVQVKVSGMVGNLDPVCPFEVRRKHWSFPLMLCVLVVCVSVLGVYTIHGTLKSWVFRWLKLTDVNPSVAGGLQLLLLSPPDGSVSQLVCSLSSCLSSLGFSVALDLWSCSEISSLGPVPWLHSGLEQVRRRGGRAVLVLTQASCERAEEWSCGGAERPLKEEEQVLVKSVPSSSYSEVFDASLSLILADYLLARAQRFLLVQFDEHRPAMTLPEFLRGLPVFCLPSQSLDFVTELTRGARAGRGVPKRWERVGALRAASRALSGAIGESAAGHTRGTEHHSKGKGGWV